MPRAQSTFAAQYVRMSTEHQDFSLETQRAANAAYAARHGLTILRTFTDAGISGLTIEKRPGLKSLIAEVVGGHADFSTVLVHDVSRWGRFQNPDQAAHYEFICAEAGVHVAYCAEAFDNDGSPASGLLKAHTANISATWPTPTPWWDGYRREGRKRHSSDTFRLTSAQQQQAQASKPPSGTCRGAV